MTHIGRIAFEAPASLMVLPVEREAWSISEIAEAFGYSTRYVQKLKAKHIDFPKPCAPGRYSIAAVRRFMRELGRAEKG